MFPVANPGDEGTGSQDWWGIRLEFFRVCFVSGLLFVFVFFTDLPALGRQLQVARLHSAQPQVVLLLTVSQNTLHLSQAADRRSS